MVFGISATHAGVEEGGGDERGITPLGYLGGGDNPPFGFLGAGVYPPLNPFFYPQTFCLRQLLAISLELKRLSSPPPPTCCSPPLKGSREGGGKEIVACLLSFCNKDSWANCLISYPSNMLPVTCSRPGLAVCQTGDCNVPES